MLRRPVEAKKQEPTEQPAPPADPRMEAMKARRDAIEKRLMVVKGMKASGNLLSTIRTFRDVVDRMAASPPKSGKQAESAIATEKGEAAAVAQGTADKHDTAPAPDPAKWQEAAAKAKEQLEELERKTAERMDQHIASLEAQLRGIDGAIESYKKWAEHEMRPEKPIMRARKPVIPGTK
jgi:hypothetical protein